MSNTPNLKHQRKHLVKISSLRNRGRTGAVNDCSKPDFGASKADLIEFHREELRSRRRRQLARKPSNSWRPPRKNDDPAYRKSIWPAAKIARRRASTPNEGTSQ